MVNIYSLMDDGSKSKVIALTDDSNRSESFTSKLLTFLYILSAVPWHKAVHETEDYHKKYKDDQLDGKVEFFFVMNIFSFSLHCFRY